MTSPQVFISSAAFKGSTCREVVSALRANGFHHIELTAGLPLAKESLPYLVDASEGGSSFLVHNYFPQPEVPFVLNLASDDEETLRLSLSLCKTAIEICRDLKAPFYSVHSGFCFHAEPTDLGKEQSQLRGIPRQRAEEIFLASLDQLVQFGSRLGIRVAIENNVVTQRNAVENGSRYLGVYARELNRISEQTGVKILLDVAHVKVTAKSLGFSAAEFIYEVAPNVEAVHLSDNNGEGDTNDPITEGAWFWEPLTSSGLASVPWVLEVYNQNSQQIESQLRIIRNKFGERYEECPL
jgi:sugar phosphate isomerase/epimerase